MCSAMETVKTNTLRGYSMSEQLAEADLGEIEHKGKKVMVKIKVVRGE